MTNFSRFGRLAALIVFSAALVLSGCKSELGRKPENLKVPRLMVEARGVTYGSLQTKAIELPQSGTKVALQKEPLINEFDILNAELVKVQLGMALLLELSEKGARELYRGTVTNMGGRIVLLINGNPVGARRIDGPIQNGKYYTFVELPDESLGELVLDLKDSLFYLQQNK